MIRLKLASYLVFVFIVGCQLEPLYPLELGIALNELVNNVNEKDWRSLYDQMNNDYKTSMPYGVFYKEMDSDAQLSSIVSAEIKKYELKGEVAQIIIEYKVDISNLVKSTNSQILGGVKTKIVVFDVPATWGKGIDNKWFVKETGLGRFYPLLDYKL